MSWVDLLVGSGLSQRVVIVGTALVYLVLAVRRPATARESARGGLEQFASLFTLVVAALLLASAIGTLLPREAVGRLLGAAAGIRGVVLAGLLGGLLPGGPYAVYPIVRSIGEQGASLAAVVAMLVGYGAIGVGRVPFGLVFFDPRTVSTRVAVGVVGTVLVAVVAALIL
ncbi:MAG: permease [Haloferacaceae archaeon]